MFRRVSLMCLTSLLAWLLLAAWPVSAQGVPGEVLVVTAAGPITPAMAGYLSRGIRAAERDQAAMLVFELSTPGGALDVMEDMVKMIRASAVPVIVYVWPSGGSASSAGTVITLAGHASAMAPDTTIGAASPVDETGQDLDQTMQAKIKQSMKARVRGLAENRGEKAIALAESTIENATAVSATEALDAGLVDFIAKDLPDLLQQLDGFAVRTSLGSVTLDTKGAEVFVLSPTFVEQLLGMLTNPNIVFLLINVGVIAVLIEISSPGGWVAGFLGVICLALAAYGLNILPVNYFGVIFLALSFILFILDIKAPTHGALTIAGVGSLIAGALILFNTPEMPAFQPLSTPLVIASSVVTGAMFFSILLLALRAQKAPVRVGIENVVGKIGVSRSELNPSGLVYMDGEQWSAELVEDHEPLPNGSPVQVVATKGLKLIVRRAA